MEPRTSSNEDEFSFGPHIFPGPFSRRKMKLLLYQFSLPLLTPPHPPRPRVPGLESEFHVFAHLSFRFLTLLSIPCAALPLASVLTEVHEAATGMPKQKRERLCIQKGCTAAVGCWDTKDSFRDCGRNFAAVTDELLSASCLILPLPGYYGPPSPLRSHLRRRYPTPDR